MTKIKTKVSSSLMNEIFEELVSDGVNISKENIVNLRKKNLVSSNTREMSSLKMKDGGGVYYTVGLSFTSSEKGHSLIRTKEMDDFTNEVNDLKKKYCESVTTTISNPTVVSS